MKCRAVFGGDPHLEETAWVNQMATAGDSFRALDEMIDLCNEHNVDLFLPGDIFSAANPSPGVVLRFRACLDRLREGLKCYVVLGNHDVRIGRSWTEVSTRCEIIDRRTVTIAGGIRVHGVNFTPPWILRTFLAETTFDCDILMMHQAWSELSPGQAINSLTEIKTVRETIVFTGDLHHTVETRTTCGPVISPGATHLTAIDQPVDKFCFLLRQSQEGGLHFMKVPLASRGCRRFEVHFTAGVQPIVDEIMGLEPPSHGMLPIYQVKHALDVSILPIQDVAPGRVVLFEELLSVGGSIASGQQVDEEEVALETLDTAIAQTVEDPDMAKFAQSLWRLSGQDLAASIASYRELYLASHQGASC